ncbi:hypothetical protein B0H13DRAFT_2309742 [Mycena leptocephala]|nr:hypothetical protein B0H13DRAFT_2309742 [Mycena leptocephala]
MSHCYITGRLPVASVSNLRAGWYLLETVILDKDEHEYSATFRAYMTSPPQIESLFDLEAAYANNGGADITLSTDFREMELLGSVSPSDENYLATCPTILAPRFNVLGVASSLSTTDEFFWFNIGGTSWIVDANQPFTIRVRVDRANSRWAKFFMPADGQTIAAGGRLIGREQVHTGILIIELTHITYGPTPRPPPNSPSKGGSSPSKGTGGSGSGYGNKQRSLKRRRDDDNKDKDEVETQLQQLK